MATINGTNGADTLNGTAADDEINGLDGNDLLIAGGGRDTLNGGAGADTMDSSGGYGVFYVDDPNDVVIAGGGSLVVTSTSYTISGRNGGEIAEVRALSGAGPINLTGTFYPERLVGNESANIIDGGLPLLSLSRDSLIGLGGDDTYVVYGTNNLVFEDAGQGFDTVLVGFNTEAAEQVYSLVTSRDLTGISSVEVLAMQDAAATFASTLSGNAFDQTIIGNAGANRITGGGGRDTLIGLGGDDTYGVSTGDQTVIRENAGGGSDTVLVANTGTGNPTYLLAGGVSIEFLAAGSAAGTDRLNLTGNELSQQITGNDGANILNGGGATSGAGDTLIGLGGSDTYLVQGLGDVVIEANGGGNDIVYSTVSYNLGSNEVEALSTVDNSATTPINLVGNFVSQLIVGNYGDNILNGGTGGVDTLVGLFGNDTYAVGESRTVVIERAGQGNDTLVTSVDYRLDAEVSIETFAAQDRASTTGLRLSGNEFAQTIAGTAGNDTITGGAGIDTLIGDAGADTFVFETSATGNFATLVDFMAGTDRIGLARQAFGALGTTLDASEFVIGTGATSASAQIVYNQATGQLFYDADGTGFFTPALFAQLAPGTAITAASFDVIVPTATVG